MCSQPGARRSRAAGLAEAPEATPPQHRGPRQRRPRDGARTELEEEYELAPLIWPLGRAIHVQLSCLRLICCLAQPPSPVLHHGARAAFPAQPND